MKAVDRILDRISPVTNWIERQARRIKLPGFDGLSLFDVASFFFKGLFEGAITTRAGSISWSFFLAMFPAIIFFFNLIPFIPIEGFQGEIFEIMEDVLPPTTYELARTTIDDILNHRRGDLLSFTFLATLFFATNGTMSLISNVSITFHQIDSRVFWQQYLVALLLTVGLGVLLLIAVAAILFGSNITEWMITRDYIPEESEILIQFARYIILLLAVLVAISLLFYYGPTKKKEWGFFSPGAVFATLLIVVTSFAFGIYVDNFNSYNKLYGSIGALLVIMLWIYINSISVVVGFELNASIAGARKRRSRLEGAGLD
ncbi:MAG: YihY/virulence factor BrkB family protein [Flavobacteriia bacterium]|nr:YihY/virulence factor BrkB family protein [Flavobacteriia bacterium]